MISKPINQSDHSLTYCGAIIRLSEEYFRRGILQRATEGLQFLSRPTVRRESKVCQFNQIVRKKHNIFRFQVSMHDVQFMAVLDRIHDLEE